VTIEEQIAQAAAEFKARAAKWKAEREPLPPGHSGPLNVEPLPEDVVDAMEAAINEAFEQVEEEPTLIDDRPVER
jgi:hypothetical protein